MNNQLQERYLVKLDEVQEAMAHLVCVRCDLPYRLHGCEDHLFVGDAADISMEDRN